MFGAAPSFNAYTMLYVVGDPEEQRPYYTVVVCLIFVYYYSLHNKHILLSFVAVLYVRDGMCTIYYSIFYIYFDRIPL